MITVLFLPTDTPARPMQEAVMEHIAKKYGQNADAVKKSLAAYEALARLYDDFCRQRGKPCTSLPSVTYTEEGRPFFSDCSLSFSLSHTEGMAAAVLSDGGRVGIDIERARPDKETLHRRLFEKKFFEEERRLWGADTFEDAFLKIWTTKEAVAKATDQPILSVNTAKLPRGLALWQGKALSGATFSLAAERA